MKREEEKKQQYNVFQNVKYVILNFWKWDKSILFISLLSIVVTMLLPFIPVLISKYVVELVTLKGELIKLIQTIAFFIAVLLLLNILSNYINYRMTFSSSRNRLKYSLQADMKSIDIDYEIMENPNGQLKNQKAQNSINGGSAGTEQILRTLNSLLSNIFGLCTYSIIIFTLNPIIVLVLSLSTIVVYFLQKNDNKWNYNNKDKWVNIDRKLSYIERQAGNFEQAKDIRLYSMTGWFTDLYKSILSKRVLWYKKQENRGRVIDICSTATMLIRDGVAYGYLIYRIYNGGLSAADFVLYFGVISQFSNWLVGIFDSFTKLDRYSLQICELREFLEIKDISNREKGVEIPTATSEITIKNLSYSYFGNEKAVIDNINLNIKKGEKIAIVGLNGAGKTTLIKLICGLYKPSKGEIIVGGNNISKYNRDEYYKIISPVFQDIYLLPLSIAKNIALCNEEDIDYQKLEEVLKLSGLYDKVQKLPEGVNTILVKSVRETSVDLSGGEKQKLALARALYKGGKMIILDEPTAALDPIAENEMYLKYNDLTKDSTSIFISHRLSSTRFCDRIVFLENGKIAEIGTHDELMKLNGKYAELFEVQSHYYKEELSENE